MSLLCPELHRRPYATMLGKAFSKSFAVNSAGLGKGEIVLFRAMQKSLQAIANPPDLIVEEYHGAGHQVMFKGNGSYSRTSARCELSDLLIIVFDKQTNDARLTYIQAKSERTVSSNSRGIASVELAANLEQWDLLARRPLITGVGSFSPPPDLLSIAQLESVGSFAFFLHGAGGVDIHYAAAAYLQKPPHYVSRYGRLTAGPDICRCLPSPECLSVYGNEEFGAFLFGLMIGTPVLSSGCPTTGPVCSWLAAQLRGFAAETLMAEMAERPVALAIELADLLDPGGEAAATTPNVGAKTLLLFGIGPGDRRAD